MPQLGAHMLIGLAGIRTKSSFSKFLGWGFMTGSILPDIDFIPVILTYPFDRDLAISFHRTFSHSILTAILVVLAGILIKTRKPYLFYFFLSCGIGMFFHSFLDLFFWFASVKIFWPFGGEYSIWTRLIIPDAYWNIMSSLECLAYGTFIYVFHRMTKATYLLFYKLILIFLILMTIILVPIGFQLSRIQFEPISYGIAIIFGFIPSIILIKRNFSILL